MLSNRGEYTLPENGFSYKIKRIITKIKENWQGIVFLSIGLSVTVYIFYGVFIYGR